MLKDLKDQMEKDEGVRKDTREIKAVQIDVAEQLKGIDNQLQTQSATHSGISNRGGPITQEIKKLTDDFYSLKLNFFGDSEDCCKNVREEMGDIIEIVRKEFIETVEVRLDLVKKQEECFTNLKEVIGKGKG